MARQPLLLAAQILWLFVFALRHGVPRHTLVPVLALLAVGQFSLSNAAQPVAEPLFSLLSLLVLQALLSYAARPSAGPLLAAGLASAMACVTRTIGLFWLVPLVLVAVAAADLRPARRVTHALGYVALACAPAAAWMAFVFRATGTLTGSDRFGPRPLPALLGYWPQLTTFSNNVSFTFRSFVLDFFSISQSASHAAVEAHALSLADALAAGLVVWATVAAAGALRLRDRAERSPRARLRATLASPLSLMSVAAVTYLGWLIALWTVGNNDPIYSRFLYPAYTPLLLVALLAEARLAEEGAPLARRLPLLLLLVWVLAAQVARFSAGT